MKVDESVSNPWLQLPEYALLENETAGSVSARRPEPYTFRPIEVDPRYDEQELVRHTRYPNEARRFGIEGRVIVRVLVDRKGGVAEARIDEPAHVLLEMAAVDAVRQIRFTHAQQNGVPVAVWIQIPFNFSLR